MTSLLSDMRMVRPQGLTFRITQPHGLRILYLGQLKAIVRGETKYCCGVCAPRYTIITLEYATPNKIVIFNILYSWVVCHYY